MTQQKTPYPTRVDLNPIRTSLNFLQNINTILEKHAIILNTSTNSLKFQSSFSSVRILNGPQPQIKTVILIRTITQHQTSSNYNYYIYMSINLLDISNPSLHFKTILQQIQPINQRVRDLAIHPNGKQLLIFYQKQMKKYTFLKSENSLIKNIQYQLVNINNISLRQQLLISDINYHPTGQFVFGIAGYQNNSNLILKPFKLDTHTLSLEFGNDISDKCINSTNKFYKYLRKWFVALDKNRYHHAMISGSMDTVCIVDLPSMKITYLNLTDNTATGILPQYPSIQTSFKNRNIIPSSTTFLNATNTGYFVTLESFSTLANRFQLSDNPTLQDSFNIFTIDLNKDDDMVKCIDIDDINAFACIKYGGTDIFLTKLNETSNQTMTTKLIKNKIKQKIIVTNDIDPDSYINTIKNQMTQQIFYDKPSGQICQFYDLSIQCFQIQTQCSENSQWVGINTCNSICQKNGENSYWNPITMVCQTCTNCTCINNQSFNPYFGNCQLNCSKVDFAIPGSQYGNNTRCSCKSPLTWHHQLQICRYNCSKVAFYDPNANLENVSYNQCICLHNYKYLKTQQLCIISLDTQQVPQIHQLQQKKLSGWGIFYIVLFILFFIALIVLIIRKCRKDKTTQPPPSTQANQQLPQLSQRQKSQKHSFLQTSQTKLQPPSTTTTPTTNQKICSICHNNQIQVNCSGPCGHHFHFSCVKEIIDKGENQCPECKRVFNGGLVDLKFVDKEEEIWSISER